MLINFYSNCTGTKISGGGGPEILYNPSTLCQHNITFKSHMLTFSNSLSWSPNFFAILSFTSVNASPWNTIQGKHERQINVIVGLYPIFGQFYLCLISTYSLFLKNLNLKVTWNLLFNFQNRTPPKFLQFYNLFLSFKWVKSVINRTAFLLVRLKTICYCPHFLILWNGQQTLKQCCWAKSEVLSYRIPW